LPPRFLTFHWAAPSHPFWNVASRVPDLSLLARTFVLIQTGQMQNFS
jgi:hypothetical protein